jgi:hypothetical protein
VQEISWRVKKTRNLQRAHFSLTHATPLLPATTLSLLRHFLRTTTAMAKKKITGAELAARAKANGYQRSTHRDKDSLRDRNKHVDKVKRDQDTALDRYVL